MNTYKLKNYKNYSMPSLVKSKPTTPLDISRFNTIIFQLLKTYQHKKSANNLPPNPTQNFIMNVINLNKFLREVNIPHYE